MAKRETPGKKGMAEEEERKRRRMCVCVQAEAEKQLGNRLLTGSRCNNSFEDFPSLENSTPERAAQSSSFVPRTRVLSSFFLSAGLVRIPKIAAPASFS
ncbi:hypothetical protein KM043_011544 [Ampulex compressa]|nr:hypothetical protein KM043_011544 [Ampulex compressa]